MKLTHYIYLATLVTAAPLGKQRLWHTFKTLHGHNSQVAGSQHEDVSQHMKHVTSRPADVNAASSSSGDSLSTSSGLSLVEYLADLFGYVEHRMSEIMSQMGGASNSDVTNPTLLPIMSMPSSINPGGPMMTAPPAASAFPTRANSSIIRPTLSGPEGYGWGSSERVPAASGPIGYGGGSGVVTPTVSPTASGPMGYGGSSGEGTATPMPIMERGRNSFNSSSTPLYGVLPPASTFLLSSPSSGLTVFMPIPVSSPTITPAASSPSSLPMQEQKEIERWVAWLMNFLDEYVTRYITRMGAGWA